MSTETEVLDKATRKKTDIEYNKPTLSREDLKTVLEALVEDHLSTGSVTSKFEKAFSSTFRTKNVISANSLTAAYHLAFLSLEIQPGDKVALSTYAPLAALDAIFLIQAQPLVIDLERHSFHISIAGVASALEDPSVKAIVVDHTFGSLLDFSKYDFKGIPVIEDFSEAVGARTETFTPGRQGKISICGLSVEYLITTGNGALICTDDDSISKKIRARKNGKDPYPRKDCQPRMDYDMIDYQAALGIEQLSNLGVILERKRKIAQIYLQSLQGSQVSSHYNDPASETFNRFVILAPGNYEQVERYFRSLQIGTRRTMEEPIHHILELPNADFPNGERLFQRGHCIPVYPNLTKDNIQRISQAIRRIY
ncbi:DegT/DnrJ/EryC1/StrS aminotransferase family protein [Leptospira broomii serovar Hurstbridge str. 5399]|uniref:DegT/DnrJ/EryC1/StrS aminotransferase family protein n=1 Tax=Leptospira broomii serovar Hurstbridge str. 5399 TaxID=1049789 RepID=T0EZ34_9LEPT|nr:DegT/DnrJ/EryC1/StrS aminotransferase family protein [Leptospira broomii]EQA44115.1 DegT/DnrJ/EryC1/StrS aminotransferase family protein [Leptospira broomii serovar Hurstbridge str. 5399]